MIIKPTIGYSTYAQSIGGDYNPLDKFGFLWYNCLLRSHIHRIQDIRTRRFEYTPLPKLQIDSHANKKLKLLS